MKVQQTLSFKKTVKKLHKIQKKELDSVIRKIMNNPYIGQQKKGELSEVRVFKFKMAHSLILLAYLWEEDCDQITLLKV